jgi:hypothetical protein
MWAGALSHTLSTKAQARARVGGRSSSPAESACQDEMSRHSRCWAPEATVAYKRLGQTDGPPVEARVALLRMSAEDAGLHGRLAGRPSARHLSQSSAHRHESASGALQPRGLAQVVVMDETPRLRRLGAHARIAA